MYCSVPSGWICRFQDLWSVGEPEAHLWLAGRKPLCPPDLLCRLQCPAFQHQIAENIAINLDIKISGIDSIVVANDETVEVLTKQALLQAQMGCDVIAPSDMMDGRVGKIRKVLDKNGYELVQILSYAVKYASNFYGPFRDAVGSKKFLKSDKKNYQMNFLNQKEAFREVALDIKEGADFVMVKPGLPYLDIIKEIKDNFKIPVFAYQVSGEYSLIKSGIYNKIINDEAIIESLISFKRAGANAIVTYFALEIAKKLR